jgi:hypothetical protein
MSTVGYGDVTARNTAERALSSLNILVSSVIFGYFINVIGGIIIDHYRVSKDIKRKMYIINRYMQDRGVAQNIQMQIRLYLGYQWEHDAVKNV